MQAMCMSTLQFHLKGSRVQSSVPLQNQGLRTEERERYDILLQGSFLLPLVKAHSTFCQTSDKLRC